MNTPLRVLLVEDSEDDALLLLRELQRGGFAVAHRRVEDAEQMRAALYEEEWDVVISDYALPRFSAPDALALFQSCNLDLPFIVVSGAIGEETAVAIMKTGAHDVVLKHSLHRLGPAISRELRDAETRCEHRRTVAAMQRQMERTEALLRIAERLNVQIDLGKAIDTVCEEAARALGSDTATVGLYDARIDAFVQAGTFGLPHEECVNLPLLPRATYDNDIAGNNSVVVVPDIQQLPSLPQAEFFRRNNIRTVASVNMVREGRIIGLLTVTTIGYIRDFSADDLALLQGMSHHVASALANARLFEQANQRTQHLQALHAIDVAISASLDIHVVLSVILDQITTQLNVDASAILLFDQHARVLKYAAGRGFRSTAIGQSYLHIGEGYAGKAILERRMVWIDDMRKVSDFKRSSLLYGEQFVAYYCVPLIAKGHIKGAIDIFHRTKLNVDAEWEEFLTTLAGQAAIAIDNAEMFSNLQRANDSLQVAYDATLEGWVRALDLRDKETEGHTQRVTELTLRLSGAMGLKDRDLVHIRRGALLHDIGKIAIPDYILLKQGPLTDEEWVIMRKHPVYAYEWLSPIEFLRPALDIPYCHHEKWDGSGYPRGLKGEQIPLAARIFSVVDVWDALRSDRPYRHSWPVERVRQHIKTSAGTHFDPAVVEVFLDLIETV